MESEVTYLTLILTLGLAAALVVGFALLGSALLCAWWYRQDADYQRRRVAELQDRLAEERQQRR